MRIATGFRLFLFLTLTALPLAAFGAGTPPAPPSDEAGKALPTTFEAGAFSGRGGVQPVKPDALGAPLEDFRTVSAAVRAYNAQASTPLLVTLVKTRSDSGAYALLTWAARWMREKRSAEVARLDSLGTAAVASSNGDVAFFKGPNFVLIQDQSGKGKDAEQARSLAQLIAGPLDKGEGEIPVLVKHLPEWEKAQEQATYAVSLAGLERTIGAQPVMDAVSFEGGAEAVAAEYGPSKLVIVEYTTPQISIDSDARIAERIKQLQGEGGPVPSAYRRVGNYSVFVFDAPDERAAAQLIDQISYEQVVQWLGTNPHLLERAQKEYVNTMGGTILAVLKASGLSLIVCFGLGGLVGALVFKRRRAQAASVEAYSDAGGMLRLNIDEMTAQSDPARLLGRGEG